MKYAVITSGGKQYKVAEGNIVEIEKVEAEPGKELILNNILFYAEDSVHKIGRPELDGIIVTAKVLEQKKDKKIRVAKFKAKSRYRKVIGHRQLLTKIQIAKIESKPEKKKEE